MTHPDRRISELGRRQYGTLSHEQLMKGGLSPDQIKRKAGSGRVERDYRGVYHVGGAPGTWRGQLAALVLGGGPGTAVSHRAAVEVHGILPFGQPLEVVTPRPRRFRVPLEDPIIHTSVVLPDEDVTEREGLVITTVPRSLLDLGAVATRRQVQYAVDSALRFELTDLDELASLLSARRKKGRRGVKALEAALLRAGGASVPGSRYERDVLELIAQLGCPEPVTQYHVVLPSGRNAYLDLAWPAWQLGVEIDGHGSHATRSERGSDAARQNELHLVGWKLLRFTTNQVHEQPELVGTTILKALSPFL